jgi:tRNA (guanine26-N2/guanine27-N2)-dimethyltransferase
MKAVDGLAGSGVRAIRLALETDIDFERIVANDRNRESFEQIKENLRRNGLEGSVTASGTDLAGLLSLERFDYIDVDPFGSPVEFIPAAARAVRHGGLLGITATDTGPLCGTNPSTCLRRYGAISMRSEHMHETAARILVGFCMRQAATIDIGLRPLLAQSGDHYIRIYLRAERGVGHAEKALSGMGYLDSGRRQLALDEGCPVKGRVAGPMWLGPLFDREFLAGIRQDFGERVAKNALNPGEAAPFAEQSRLSRILERMADEAEMPAFFFELDAMASRAKANPPPMAALLAALGAAGFRASRTHFTPSGFRTDAPLEELELLFRALSEK